MTSAGGSNELPAEPQHQPAGMSHKARRLVAAHASGAPEPHFATVISPGLSSR